MLFSFMKGMTHWLATNILTEKLAGRKGCWITYGKPIIRFTGIGGDRTKAALLHFSRLDKEFSLLPKLDIYGSRLLLDYYRKGKVSHYDLMDYKIRICIIFQLYNRILYKDYFSISLNNSKMRFR